MIVNCKPWWNFGLMVAAGFAVALLIGLPTHAQQKAPIPELILGPPGGKAFKDLFVQPDGWSRTRSMTGALLFADHNLTQFSDSDLHKWFPAMRKWGMHLELEVGAIKSWGPTAESAFRVDQPMWDRATRLGADLRSIVMDEPLTASRSALHKSDSYAVEQTALFIQMVRRQYPSMLIGDVEPYPSISKADHLAWINSLQKRLGALGVKGLDFYRLDTDWIAFSSAGRGSWLDVWSLGTSVRRLGIPFSMIYWASGYPSENSRGLAGPDTWYIEVMSEGYALASVGARPDQFVIESWIGTPDQSVPESDGFTFTGTALNFANRFVYGKSR